MKYITRSIGIRMMICFGLIGMWGSVLPMAESAEAGQRINPGEGAQLRDDAEKLLKGNRSVLGKVLAITCLLYTSPSPRDRTRSRMPSSA